MPAPNPMPDFTPDEQELHTLLGNPRPSCPPLDVLLAYTEDVLPPDQTNAVRHHLAACKLCPLLLADLATLPAPQLSPAAHDRIAAKLPLRPRHASTNVRGFALLGMAAVLVFAFFLMSYRLHSRSAPPPSVATVTQPAVTPHTPRTPDISLSPLAPPQGMLTRGTSTEDPALTYLAPAFAAYNHGDYAAAAARFTQLHAGYPHSETAALYLGVSQLLLHQDAQAYATLTSLQRVHTVPPDALQWYTAVAAERTHAANAPQLFAEICADKTSHWSAQSCTLVSQLQ